MLDKLYINGEIVSHTGRWRGCIGVKEGKIASLTSNPDGIAAKEVIDL